MCALFLAPEAHAPHAHAQGLVAPTSFYLLAGHPSSATTMILDELMVQPPWGKPGTLIPMPQYLAEYGVALPGGREAGGSAPGADAGPVKEMKGRAKGTTPRPAPGTA